MIIEYQRSKNGESGHSKATIARLPASQKKRATTPFPFDFHFE
jgi:hypothetical protein